jgi:hypothetical protein
LTNLPELLAQLLSEADARDIVDRVGLDARYIEFRGHLVNIWNSILREAKRRPSTIRVIVDPASERYESYSDSLTIAMTEYLRGTASGYDGLNQLELAATNTTVTESKEFSDSIRYYMAELKRL